MFKLIHKMNQMTCQVLTRETVTDQISNTKANLMRFGLARYYSRPGGKTAKSSRTLHQVFSQRQAASLLTLKKSLMSSTVRSYNSSTQFPELNATSETRDDEVLKDLALSATPLTKSVFSSYQSGIADTKVAPRNTSSDLHMFLQEVGTDQKEARFWLKHFQSAVDHQRPFAVVQVDQEVIHSKKTLQSLCSCLSFLSRHQMQVVIVHGPGTPFSDSQEEYWIYRRQLFSDSMILVDALETYDTISRPIIHGASVFEVQHSNKSDQPELTVNMGVVQWALHSGSIVLVQSLGELSDGRLVPVDVMRATTAIAKQLKPLKVLLINIHGGLTNEKGQVIANVNIPNDLNDIYQSPWCNSIIREKINDIVSLIHCLPIQSSVVISSAPRLLAELFTHRGSGTFFKMSECVHKFKNISEVDCMKLSQLIESGFRRKLDKQYLERLDKQLNTLFIVEGYAAAAIITNENGFPVPYLDKFVVSSSRMGESFGEMLWDSIRLNFPQLFWRSRNSNIINSWYFMQCDGCKRFDEWTVFWYGAIPDVLLNHLVEYATSLPSSFRSS